MLAQPRTVKNGPAELTEQREKDAVDEFLGAGIRFQSTCGIGIQPSGEIPRICQFPLIAALTKH